MQKNLTVLFAFAIFVLVLVWAVTPAQADPPPHDHGGGGNGNDETFFVDLSGGMFTMGLPVTVIQDSSKTIRFNNTNFNLDSPGIVMQFPFPSDPAPQCEDIHDNISDDEFDKFLDELAGVNIASGFLTVEIDKKKKTGILVLEYTSPDLGGLTRIQYHGQIAPPPPVVSENIKSDGTFKFDGTIFVWQLGESGNTDDKIVACPGQVVDGILTSSAGQQ